MRHNKFTVIAHHRLSNVSFAVCRCRFATRRSEQDTGRYSRLLLLTAGLYGPRLRASVLYNRCILCIPNLIAMEAAIAAIIEVMRRRRSIPNRLAVYICAPPTTAILRPQSPLPRTSCTLEHPLGPVRPRTPAESKWQPAVGMIKIPNPVMLQRAK
jgi:hypothetical protein